MIEAPRGHESKTRLAATDGAVKVPIRRQANRTVIAVLVHSEQRVIRRDGALFYLAHRPKLRNTLAGAGDDNSFAAFYSGNEAREVSLRIIDIDDFAAHMGSLAKRGALIKPARRWGTRRSPPRWRRVTSAKLAGWTAESTDSPTLGLSRNLELLLRRALDS